jgi:hypothetical protein
MCSCHGLAEHTCMQACSARSVPQAVQQCHCNAPLSACAAWLLGAGRTIVVPYHAHRVLCAYLAAEVPYNPHHVLWLSCFCCSNHCASSAVSAPCCCCAAAVPLCCNPFRCGLLQILAEPLDMAVLWEKVPYIAEFVEDLPVGECITLQYMTCSTQPG